MDDFADDDYMEMGNGLIAQPEGWWLDTTTGNTISPEGLVYDKHNDCIWDPALDESYEQ